MSQLTQKNLCPPMGAIRGHNCRRAIANSRPYAALLTRSPEVLLTTLAAPQ